MEGAPWTDISKEAQDLISKILVVDPEMRLTVDQCLDHPWFSQKVELTEQRKVSILPSSFFQTGYFFFKNIFLIIS